MPEAPNVVTLDLGSKGCRWSWKQRQSGLSVLDEGSLPQAEDFKQGWKEVHSSIPSDVHVELLKIGAIPDPYMGFNEHKVQWVGDVEWLYRGTFQYQPTNHQNAFLSFEGLDTLCDIYLNNEKVLSTQNQFQTHIYHIPTFDNGPALKPENTLLLHFKSAKAFAKSEEAKYGKVRAGSTNLGDPSRVYLRKAQYDWRWDWGPELMTCGPYRTIKLFMYNVLIKDVHARTFIVNGKTSLAADVTLQGPFLSQAKLSLDISLIDAASNDVLKTSRVSIDRTTLPSTAGDSEHVLINAVAWNNLQDLGVRLWWPAGYGEQALYLVKVTLVREGDDAVVSTKETHVANPESIMDTKTKRIGFRTVKLIQEPLEEPDQYGTGTSFVFEINGVRMFMGGSNWIPADNFLTTISDERYRAWLTLLRDGNQNMVRIWGGGIYEPDVFYDVCDELGLLVWQDFQFACGVYPAHSSFVSSVTVEATQNLLRLRHHPSIAIYCGNNEDYQMVLQWKEDGIEALPARVLYEDIFPNLVERLTATRSSEGDSTEEGDSGSVPYHRGSPYGGKGWDTADPTIGDIHQWNIWGGKELQYQEYDRLGGRFVSEFGIPAHPSLDTIKYWMHSDAKTNKYIEDESEWYTQSPIMAQHTKAGAFERRFAIVMNENFKLTNDFETHVFNTQLMQSEAIGYAYRSWRREWRGKGKEYNAGVLVWQANDCWPVVSWAIADYFLRPKPVFYSIARELAPVSVGIFRTVHKNRNNDRPRQFYEFGATQSVGATIEVWGVINGLEPLAARLELTFFDLLLEDWSQSETHDIVLLPNQSTELLKIPCPGPPNKGYSGGDPQFVPSATVVVSARIVSKDDGMVLARYADWPQPYRYLKAPDPGLEVRVGDVGGAGDAGHHDKKKLTLTVQHPLKCLVLSAELNGNQAPSNNDNTDDAFEARFRQVKFSDNALDLVPGDEQIVFVHGLGDGRIRAARFGQEKARYLDLV